MKAHANTYMGGYGPATWRDAIAPNIDAGQHSGRLRGCSWCGSMYPADLAAAIKNGATLSGSDRKYGWPHKFYVDNIPNPHAGLLEIRAWSTSETPGYERLASPRFNERTGERVADHVEWVQKSVAGPTTIGKFYTEHLQDAEPEDRKVIERAMGLNFTFHDDGRVEWRPFSE